MCEFQDFEEIDFESPIPDTYSVTMIVFLYGEERRGPKCFEFFLKMLHYIRNHRKSELTFFVEEDGEFRGFVIPSVKICIPNEVIFH